MNFRYFQTEDINNDYEGQIQVQLIDFDLCFLVKDKEHLKKEIKHAFTVLYEAATMHSQTPFETFPPYPFVVDKTIHNIFVELDDSIKNALNNIKR